MVSRAAARSSAADRSWGLLVPRVSQAAPARSTQQVVQRRGGEDAAAWLPAEPSGRRPAIATAAACRPVPGKRPVTGGQAPPKIRVARGSPNRLRSNTQDAEGRSVGPAQGQVIARPPRRRGGQVEDAGHNLSGHDAVVVVQAPVTRGLRPASCRQGWSPRYRGAQRALEVVPDRHGRSAAGSGDQTTVSQEVCAVQWLAPASAPSRTVVSRRRLTAGAQVARALMTERTRTRRVAALPQIPGDSQPGPARANAVMGIYRLATL